MACVLVRVMGLQRTLNVLVCAALLVPWSQSASAAPCVGDCDGVDGVTINEVVNAVNIMLENLALSSCPNADRNGDGAVTIDEVVAAVNSFLSDPESCPMVVPATATPTVTLTRTTTTTATVTATRTPVGNCGNGFLDKGETCASCPADCAIRACTATTPLRTFTVNFAPGVGQEPTSVTVLVGYRSERVSLPGMGSAVGSRVKNRPSNAIVGTNDLDYALRVVITRSSASPLAAGRLFTVDFDSCQGAAAPTAADFGCTVEGCASSFGTIEGCTCTVAGP